MTLPRWFRLKAMKARHAAEVSGRIALADDSGLSVAALGGSPGIYSARWAGPGKDFAAAMAKVEERLEETASDDRAAWFTCALALAWLAGPADLAAIAIPVTILSAEADRIVDASAQVLAAARLKHGRLVIVAGAYHEILQETDERRAVFFAEFDRLADQVAPRKRSKA